MKNISTLFALVIVVLFAVSCDNTTPNEKAAVAASPDKIDLKAHRGLKGSYQAVDRFSLADIDVSIDAMESVAMKQMDQQNVDAQDVMALNSAFMAAEKEAQLLEVRFSMSDEPVDNGMFVFSIESPEGKSLTLEMYDEEGYEKVANNEFDVTEGNNYKALNVDSMEDGDYLFRLKDDEGRELVRTVNITTPK